MKNEKIIGILLLAGAIGVFISIALAVFCDHNSGISCLAYSRISGKHALVDLVIDTRN
jgi:hypothetical protein